MLTKRRIIAALAGLGIAVGIAVFSLYGEKKPEAATQAGRERTPDSAIKNRNSTVLSRVKSEDAARSSATLGEALAVLLPRVKAGDFDALRALVPLIVTCSAFLDEGRNTFDEFVVDKSLVSNPTRQALITKQVLFCQSGGKAFNEAQQIVRDQDKYAVEAIRRGNPEAIIEGHLTRNMKRVAPEYATKEAFLAAEAQVAQLGSPAAKSRVAFARMVKPENLAVQSINREAAQAGESNIAELQLAASTLYGCQEGLYCGKGSQFQESGCLVKGICDDVDVPAYFKRQFTSQQLGLIDRYLLTLKP